MCLPIYLVCRSPKLIILGVEFLRVYQRMSPYLSVLVVRKRLVELSGVRRNIVLVVISHMARRANSVLVVGAGQALLEGPVGALARLRRRSITTGRASKTSVSRGHCVGGGVDAAIAGI